MEKKYYSLAAWIITLLVISSVIGSLTNPAIDGWYLQLKHAPLTPPNYVFGIVWTLLYTLIAYVGWMIWSPHTFSSITTIRTIYVMQMVLNWTWPPIFFIYHFLGLALLISILLTSLVGALVYFLYPHSRWAALSMAAYFCWLGFASYLNAYTFLMN